MTSLSRTIRPFTGGRMFLIFLAAFGLIFAVNFYMAWLAVTTFTGTVVENSYVASQQFNGWLAEARAEKALGWKVSVELDPARYVLIHATDKNGRPLAPLDATGTAGLALVNAAPQPLHFVPVGAGEVRGSMPLPQGRWQIRLNLTSGAHRVRDSVEFR